MERPLKFCHLSTFYPPYSFGGDALSVYHLSNALARRGHDVDVIHCADSFHVLHPGQPSGQFTAHPNVAVHTLRSRWGSLSPLIAQQTGRAWLKTKRIQEVFSSKKFDVIHYHNISLLGPEVLRLSPDHRDFIKVYTAHEHWLVCPMHVLWKDNERLCDKPECFRCALKFRRPPQLWRSTRLLENCLQSVDMFLSPSLFARDMHHRRGFTPEFQYLPHFVPPVPAASEQPDDSPRPRPYFLFVGRLEKIKGLQTLLPVFREYAHADLVVAGTGEFEPELRRLAAQMQNVFFLGSLPQSQLRRFYRHAIAVMVPSICYEVFGIVILESYRERTPVIVRRLGALQELVKESQGGLSYETPEELLAAMERLRTDSAVRRAMGEFGYQKHLERWSESAHIEDYMRLLGQAAERKFGSIPWRQPQCQPCSQ